MSESLSSGMNLIDALSLSAGILSSKLFKKKLAASIKSVSEGEPLSGALHISGLCDDIAISLISAGERSSSLDKVFSQLSIMYEDEIESGLRTFTALIEPASTLATGVVVGIIVFAMFMPIIKLISVLGG
jgi:type IV pilus assembly protein PilC